MNLFSEIKQSLLHLAFPHICAGCGSDMVDPDQHICLACFNALPKTGFELYSSNPVTAIFNGRLPVVQATSHFYFTKQSVMQQLLHEFKYRGNKELGYYLGSLVGRDLKQSPHFDTIDALVPLPLYESKERQRGYNQAEVLANGISAAWQKPVLKGSLIRNQYTESQTRKSRVERWQNMKDRFKLVEEEQLAGKHLLLIDDVITTGATLEAAGRALLQAKNVQVSIATLCFSVD